MSKGIKDIAFIIFCIVIVGLNSYIALREDKTQPDINEKLIEDLKVKEAKIDSLQRRIKENKVKIDTIHLKQIERIKIYNKVDTTIKKLPANQQLELFIKNTK